MSTKKTNAVVFGSTSNHAFAIACVMMDLSRLSPGLVDEVIIFHDGIDKSDQTILSTILPTRLIEYEFPIKDRSVLNAPSVRQFTKMVFTKFECLRLLDEYRNVLWLDYDIVIQSDISELFLPSKTGIKFLPGGLKVSGQLRHEISEYDLDREGMCASTFVFQDTLDEWAAMYSFCYNRLQKYADDLYMPEQAIFDFMIQEFRLSPEIINPKEYTPHPTDPKFADSAKIIHSYGQPKFWNGLENNQWDSNYKTWLDAGGTGYIPPKPPSLALRTFRKIKRVLVG